jgi:hypothetical protein
VGVLCVDGFGVGVCGLVVDGWHGSNYIELL